MLGARATRLSRTLVTIVTGAILWSSIATVALAADKTYTASFVSSAFDAGASYGVAPRAALQLKVQNSPTSQVQLGSANVSQPLGGGVRVTSAAIGATPVVVSDGVIQLRNLSLPPGGEVTVSVSAEVECAANHQSYIWPIAAKQANDFNGTGNDNVQIGSLSNTVEGACSLEFSEQPASAANAPVVITNKIYDGNVPPAERVTVRVKAFGLGETVTWWSGTITLAVGANQSGGNPGFSGGAALPGSGNGVYKFAPSIAVTSSAYTLIATADPDDGPSEGTSSSVESGPFNIVDEASICGATTGCFTKTNGPKTIAQVNAGAGGGSAGDVVIVSISSVVPAAEQCAGYVPDSDLITFDVTEGDGITPSERAKIATVTLLAQFVTKAASKYQVCYNDGSGPVLLPTCANKNPTLPCVVSKVLDKAKNLVIVVAAPKNDPKMNF
jgi:hypothetical protein